MNASRHVPRLGLLLPLGPAATAIDIAHRVYLEAATLPQLASDLWPLAVIATVTLSAASWMFRHRLT